MQKEIDEILKAAQIEIFSTRLKPEGDTEVTSYKVTRGPEIVLALMALGYTRDDAHGLLKTEANRRANVKVTEQPTILKELMDRGISRNDAQELIELMDRGISRSDAQELIKRYDLRYKEPATDKQYWLITTRSTYKHHHDKELIVTEFFDKGPFEVFLEQQKHINEDRDNSDFYDIQILFAVQITKEQYDSFKKSEDEL